MGKLLNNEVVILYSKFQYILGSDHFLFFSFLFFFWGGGGRGEGGAGRL